MDASYWLNQIAHLRTHKKNEKRSPHKPLLTLLIIAQAEHGGQNRFQYCDIERKLSLLIAQFGPRTNVIHQELPFWHLRTDRFWEIETTDTLVVKAGGSPSKSSLLKTKACGRVTPEFWALLCERSDFREQVTATLLHEFWPASLHPAVREAVGLQVDPLTERSTVALKRRRRDAAFREHVLRAYSYQCAICGFDGRISGQLFGVEAAHVKWHAYDGDDELSNGLALCAQHHIALDSGVIAINEEMRLLISADLTGGEAIDQLFYRHEGKVISLPQAGFERLRIDNLNWHRKEVFKFPERKLYSLTPEILRAAEGA